MTNDSLNNPIYEEYAVAKEFDIDGSTMTIEITGREDIIAFTTGELYSRYIQERISHDHIFFNNRIWKANLSKKGYDPKVFVSLAQKITCTSVLSDKISVQQYRYIVSGDKTAQQYYQDPNNVSNKLGYFDGEIYPFGIVFKLDDGTKTSPYPIKGNNEGSPVYPPVPKTNDKGLVWIKKLSALIAGSTKTDPERWTVGLDFNLVEFLDELRSNSDFANVVGYYIVRGERIVNQLYDGYMTRTAKGVYFMKDREHYDHPTTDPPEKCLGGTRGKVHYKNPTTAWFGSNNIEESALNIPVFKDLVTKRKGQYTYKGKTYGTDDMRNLYYFPIVVTNDNYPETKLPIQADMPDEYEYTRAYSWPWARIRAWQMNEDQIAKGNAGTGLYGPGNTWKIEDSQNHGNPNANSNEFIDEFDDCSNYFQDSLDVMLLLSDDHFAVMSPDFSMEKEHLFAAGDVLYAEFYTKNQANDVWSTNPPVPEEFTTVVYKKIELLPDSTSSQIAGTYTYENCGNEFFKSWEKDDPDIRYQYFKQHKTGDTYLVPYGQSGQSVVTWAGETWVCIQNTLKAQTDPPTDDDEPDKANSKYWEKVTGNIIWGIETSPYKFESATWSVADQWYSQPGCKSRVFTKPIPPPTGGKPTEANWANTTYYDGVKSQQFPAEYTRNERGAMVHGSYKIFSQTREAIFDSVTPIVHKVVCYPVDKGINSSPGNFCSLAEDGYKYRSNGKRGLFYETGNFKMATVGTWFGIGADASMKMSHYNRSYQTPAYIGFIPQVDENTGVLPTFFTDMDEDTEYMVKFYRTDPSDPKYMDTILPTFNQEYTEYWNISNFHPVAQQLPVLRVFKGDNYKSQVWERMCHHYDFDENASRSATGFHIWGRNELNLVPKQFSCQLRSSLFGEKDYMHGYLHGIFTSNRHNVNYRANIDVLDPDNEILTYTYFPRVVGLKDAESWVRSSAHNSDRVESMLIPAGYDRTQGYVLDLGYDERTPKDSYQKGTRIAWSARKIAESFRDNYRIMQSSDFQDFSTNFGHIIRISELFGTLYSVRNRAILRHVVGENKLAAGQEQMISVPSSIYLAPDESPVAYYGIQNWFAFLQTKDHLYGIDERNKTPWRVTIDYSSTGSKYPKFENMADAYSNTNYFDKLFETKGPFIGSPNISKGISIGYNQLYREVYFTFFSNKEPTTLLFNERLTAFTGTTSLSASLYIPWNDKLLTTFYNALPNEFYVNDQDQDVIRFYGKEYMNRFSFIVNGASEEKNSSLYEKIYSSLKINMPDIELESLEYITERQDGKYSFVSNGAEGYLNSEYLEGDWNIPIIRDRAKKDDIYIEDSEFRGRWLKVTLTYKGNKDLYIRSIISKFDISYI